MFVYYITSPLLRGIKVGRWSGTVRGLQRRYQTYYGRDLDLGVFQCASSKTEKDLHRALEEYRLDGEVFDESAKSVMQTLAGGMCEPHVDLGDDDARTTKANNWMPQTSRLTLRPWMIQHGYVTVPRDHRAALLPRTVEGDAVTAMMPTAQNRKVFYEWTLGKNGSQAALFGLTDFFRDIDAKAGDVLILEYAAHNVVLAKKNPSPKK